MISDEYPLTAVRYPQTDGRQLRNKKALRRFPKCFHMVGDDRIELPTFCL